MKLSVLIFLLVFSITLNAQISTDNFKVGDKAPSIVGIDQNGKTINSSEVLKNNKILLIFYRGNWCPHCRKHLASLQEHLDEYTKKGVYVVVVTPETVEKTQETTEKLKTNFSIIHDVDNKIMNDFGVAFEVNKQNVPSYYGAISKKVEAYNSENNNVLPVPATYLIDKNKELLYVHYDPDYKKRSNLEEILRILD